MNTIRLTRSMALCLSLLLLLLPSPPPAAAQPACEFKLGFKALRDLIPGIVGTCLENEHFNPANGDSLQRTTRGLLVWRKADNWTAFTDGSHTWINGPYGLQSRPNTQQFSWEGRPTAGGFAAQAANLDQVGVWTVPHCEIESRKVDCSSVPYEPPRSVATSTPSGDGSALRLGLRGGVGYANALFARHLRDYPAAAAASSFELDLWFRYEPPTSFNDRNWRGDPSVIQNLEFAFGIQRPGPSGQFALYRFELMWACVRDQPDLPSGFMLLVDGRWQNLRIPAQLGADRWHHLVLRGDIDDGRAHYRGFRIDDAEYPLSVSSAPEPVPWRESVGTVVVQLDGPKAPRREGYQVFLDAVTLRWR